MSRRFVPAVFALALAGCASAAAPLPEVTASPATTSPPPSVPPPTSAARCTTPDATVGASPTAIAFIEVSGLSHVASRDFCRYLRTPAGRELDEAKLHADMVDLWRSGLFDRIDVGRRASPAGSVLAFTVHERPVIRRTSFHGMSPGFQERMVARSPGPNSILDRSMLHRRVDELRADYRRNGYGHAEVRASTTETPDNGVDIDVTVDEGPRSMVGAITFEGIGKGKENELRALVDTANGSSNAPGKAFDGEALERTRAKMVAYYADRGMVDATVEQGDLTPGSNSGVASLALEIFEGPVYKVGSVTCEGELSTDASQCIASVGLKKGAVFSRSKLEEGIARIEKSIAAGHPSRRVDHSESPDAMSGTIDIALRTVDEH